MKYAYVLYTLLKHFNVPTQIILSSRMYFFLMIAVSIKVVRLLLHVYYYLVLAFSMHLSIILFAVVLHQHPLYCNDWDLVKIE